jgi:hypothetical protein
LTFNPLELSETASRIEIARSADWTRGLDFAVFSSIVSTLAVLSICSMSIEINFISFSRKEKDLRNPFLQQHQLQESSPSR